MPKPHPLDTAYHAYLLHRQEPVLLTAVRQAAYLQATRKCKHDVAEDIAQAASIDVSHGIEGYSLTGKFSSWVYTIVARRIADHYRAEKPWEPLPEVELEQAPAPYRAPEVPLDGITEEEHTILQLAYVEELPYREIAVRLDISESAARQKASRVLRKVRAGHKTPQKPRLSGCGDDTHHGESADTASAAVGKATPELPPTPFSILMSQRVMEMYAEDRSNKLAPEPQSEIVGIVHGWQPRFRVTTVSRLPDHTTTFVA